MQEPTLYERIGGPAAVETVVRTVHQRIRSDPDIDLVSDDVRARDVENADVRLLTDALLGHVAHESSSCALLARRVVVDRHLRDALWLLGMSTTLIDDVASAVMAVITRSPR